MINAKLQLESIKKHWCQLQWALDLAQFTVPPSLWDCYDTAVLKAEAHTGRVHRKVPVTPELMQALLDAVPKVFEGYMETLVPAVLLTARGGLLRVGEYASGAFYTKPDSRSYSDKADHTLRWNQVKLLDRGVALFFDHDKSGPDMKERIIEWDHQSLEWNYKDCITRYIAQRPASNYFFCHEDGMPL